VLDWPAFGTALWQVHDQLGIRPEYILPVLYLETAGTFLPSKTNPNNGAVGLNQFTVGPYGTYRGYVGVPVDQYQQWTASQQLAGPILNYWHDALSQGPIRSATRLMVAQLGPGRLANPPALGNVVYSAPSGEYAGNACVFDSPCSGSPSRGKKGYFTEQDVANVLAGYAQSPAVRDAIARAYAMRPGERPRDPVYGDDYALAMPRPPLVRPRPTPALFAIGALALTAGAAYAAAAYAIRRREPEPAS